MNPNVPAASFLSSLSLSLLLLLNPLSADAQVASHIGFSAGGGQVRGAAIGNTENIPFVASGWAELRFQGVGVRIVALDRVTLDREHIRTVDGYWIPARYVWDERGTGSQCRDTSTGRWAREELCRQFGAPTWMPGYSEYRSETLYSMGADVVAYLPVSQSRFLLAGVGARGGAVPGMVLQLGLMGVEAGGVAAAVRGTVRRDLGTIEVSLTF